MLFLTGGVIEVAIVNKVNRAKTTLNETFINLVNCYLKHYCDDAKKHFLWRHAATNLHLETTNEHLVELFANQFAVQVIFFCCFRVLSLLLHSTLLDTTRHRQKLQPSREKSQQISWKIRDRIQGEKTAKFDLLFPTRGDVVAKTFRWKRSR